MSRSILRGALLALASLAVPGPAARADEAVVRLDPTALKGKRLEVHEARTYRLSTRWKAAAGSGTKQETSTLEQRYREEVVQGQPLVLLREFSASTRTQGETGKPATESRTSLHGRTLRVVGLDQQPQGFALSQEDQDTLRFDRLARACVDDRKCEVRDAWKLPPTVLAQALFGDALPQKIAQGGAKVTLRALQQGEGGRRAILRVKLTLETERFEKLPEVRLDLEGEVVWHVDERVLLESKLDGKLRLAALDPQGNGWEASGPVRWSLQAKLLEARGDHDDAARAQGRPPAKGVRTLICTLDPAHRYALQDLACCIRCGKQLDEERRCPDKHEWALQHCPRDGAPLRHE